MRLIELAMWLALVMSSSTNSLATTYYVSPNGSDAASGTSIASAWRTVTKVNLTKFARGDRVLFQRGGVWREMLEPKASGVYYGAYGSGERPVFSGADVVTGTWVPAGRYSCSLAVGGDDLTNVWIDGVLGLPADSVADIAAPGQWVYSHGQLYLGFPAGCPLTPVGGPVVEITRRPYALYLNKTGAITVEHLAFVNGMYNSINLGQSLTETQTFNDVVWQGARYEGFKASSGTIIVTNSEGLYSRSGLAVAGGNGVSLENSILSGNTFDGLEVSGTTGGSSIQNSTISGNATEDPLASTISNWSSFPLKATNSVILPNPYLPREYNFVGLTDDGTNVSRSPLFMSRAAPLFIVPFIDDYSNLGVAEQVAAVAKQYGCPISYALNTKLVTPADWRRVAALLAAGNEIVAHTRSHSDLASNKVFTMSYTGPATTATVTIRQSAGTLQTYLDGSSTPDIVVPLRDKYGSIQNLCARVNSFVGYSCIVEGNQAYFTPLNLADVAQASLIPGFLATAGPDYLEWEIQGAQDDIAANLPGYHVTDFATPFTSSNREAEAAIQKAGFLGNRNGTVSSTLGPNGSWPMADIDVYDMAAQWLPTAFDEAHPAGSVAALVEGLGALGGVFAVYSHGFDEFSLAQWTTLFQTLKEIGGTCSTMSQARAYVMGHGTLIQDGTGRSWSVPITARPNFTNGANSPVQGAHGLR
jgi:hypothetical protein